MKQLYEELKARMKFLEEQSAIENTPTSSAILAGREAELQLCIIRVQQILLKKIKKTKK